jgi:hypothetical protein
MLRGARQIPPGSLWRQQLLGTVAVYEVLRTVQGLVEVKVRSAPGLAPDAVITLTQGALEAMERIERWP